MSTDDQGHDATPSEPSEADRDSEVFRREQLRTAIRQELLNPIDQILGYSELFQDDLRTVGHHDLVPDLQKIALATRHLTELVTNLRGFVDETDNDESWTPQGLLSTAEMMESWTPPPLEDRPSPMDMPPPPDSSRDVLGAFRRAFAASSAPEAPAADAPACLPDAETVEVAAIPDSLVVVDDDELSRNVLARHLFRNGYAVCTAEGGPEAIETLEAHEFDLVLLDIVMPDMNGLEVLRHIRKNASLAALPVIMVTGRDSTDDVVQALELGANDYVTKPLDLPLVRARIKTQLALKKALDRVNTLNEQLETTQERLARVVDSAPDNTEDVGIWARSLAAEVAGAIAVEELGVWTVVPGRGDVEVLVARSIEPPSPEEVQRLSRSGTHLERGADTLVPALGRGGELFGVVAVPRRNIAHSPAFARLLNSYARQLGGALELKRLRHDLDAAEAQRRATRDDLIDRGIDLLQVCPECGRCFDQTSARCTVDGVPLDSSRPLPHRIAGRYRLIQLLGEGGMGSVYRAFDHRLDREVAVKVIHPSQIDDEHIRGRFSREARAIARIDHPNIVAVYDCGNLDSGSLYIVMERLHGRDLERVIKTRGPGSMRDIVSLLRQSAAALSAAHEAMLIHRDIKPENIFLIPDDNGFHVKLVDFGLAKEVSADAVPTRSGTIVGTPLFMSPEQALAEPMDFRSDVYSLAAVAYYAITGRHVTLETTFASVLVDIIKSKPPLLSQLLPGVPAPVDAAFEAALAKDPERRPSEVEAWVASFADALETFDLDRLGWLDEQGRLPVDEDPADVGRPSLRSKSD